VCAVCADFVTYKAGDELYDQNGDQLSRILDDDLYDGTSPVVAGVHSYTITGTGDNGRHISCNGNPGGFPICQSCSGKGFVCIQSSWNILKSSNAAMNGGGTCCTGGNRGVLCMAELVLS
jgi:hypothetical protein